MSFGAGMLLALEANADDAFAFGCCPRFEVRVPDAWQGGFKLVVTAEPWVAGRVVQLELPHLRLSPAATRLGLGLGRRRRVAQSSQPP